MKNYALLLLLFVNYSLLAETFKLKLPIPSTVTVNNEQNFWLIDCTFSPTRSLPTQLAKKIDRKHAERICYAALKQIYKIKSAEIKFSALQVRKAPQYNSKEASFFFKVPQSTIKIVKYPTKKSSTKVATQQITPTKKIVTKTSSSTVSKENIQQIAKVPILTTNIIDEKTLENMELSGHHIRIKNDLLQALEIYREDYSKLSQNIEWDNLIKKHQLFNKIKEIEYKDTLFNDKMIIEEDAQNIYNELQKIHLHLTELVKQNMLNDISIIEKDLLDFKAEQQSLLKTIKIKADKDSTQKTIDELEKNLSNLYDIKNNLLNKNKSSKTKRDLLLEVEDLL